MVMSDVRTCDETFPKEKFLLFFNFAGRSKGRDDSFCRETKSRIHGQLVSVIFRKVVAFENFGFLCGIVRAGERIMKAYIKLCEGQ